MIHILCRNQSESARDYAVRVLVENIIDLNLVPGEKIAEQELCTQLGISRTPFREAELELAQRKLLDIRPKIGTYVSYIDEELVEQVRHLRSIMEAELAVMACRMLTEEDINKLWENVALWRLHIERRQIDKIFLLDKEFHKNIYLMCGRQYWYDLLDTIAPHFDRTTVLSFRCHSTSAILSDHENLLDAIEKRDENRAREIASSHMMRYTENIADIRAGFPAYFKV